MIWVLIVLLALAAFGLAVFVFKVPSGAREAVAAALLLGIAGYVTQGSPGEPSSPREAAQVDPEEAAMMVTARGKITQSSIPPTDRNVIIADGFARNGQTAAAARMLLGAVEDDPNNSDAWVAMANALVVHAEGNLTPASTFAFKQALKADPKAPGPPFFLGLAMAQSGKMDEARSLWSELLKRTPKDAEWRPVLANELRRLNAFIAARQHGENPADDSQSGGADVGPAPKDAPAKAPETAGEGTSATGKE